MEGAPVALNVAAAKSLLAVGTTNGIIKMWDIAKRYVCVDKKTGIVSNSHAVKRGPTTRPRTCANTSQISSDWSLSDATRLEIASPF